jgi:hypothetical protein
MVMRLEDFSPRLELALKALSIGRGVLAARLEIDKSVVSRWIKGVNGPTDHNLTKLTALIAERCPGFTMLDWDSDLPRFAEKLGVADEPQDADQGGPPPGLSGWPPPRILGEAMAATAARGEAFEGFWRSTRPAIAPSGRFIRDRILIRRSRSGLLTFRLGVIDMRFEGWAMPNQTQIVAAGVDEGSGVFIFVMLNAVLRDRADVMDGVALTCQRTAGGTPVATATLLERTGFLTGDPQADDARYEASISPDPFAPAESIPAALREHLFRDVGPSALAAGGDALLMMPFARSLARGPRPGVALAD